MKYQRVKNASNAIIDLSDPDKYNMPKLLADIKYGKLFCLCGIPLITCKGKNAPNKFQIRKKPSDEHELNCVYSGVKKFMDDPTKVLDNIFLNKVNRVASNVKTQTHNSSTNGEVNMSEDIPTQIGDCAIALNNSELRNKLINSGFLLTTENTLNVPVNAKNIKKILKLVRKGPKMYIATGLSGYAEPDSYAKDQRDYIRHIERGAEKVNNVEKGILEIEGLPDKLGDNDIYVYAELEKKSGKVLEFYVYEKLYFICESE